MPSIPGDYGGAGLAISSRDTAIIVGIRLGEHISDDGTSYGRFTSLPDALTALAVSARHG